MRSTSPAQKGKDRPAPSPPRSSARLHQQRGQDFIPPHISSLFVNESALMESRFRRRCLRDISSRFGRGSRTIPRSALHTPFDEIASLIRYNADGGSDDAREAGVLSLSYRDGLPRIPAGKGQHSVREIQILLTCATGRCYDSRSWGRRNVRLDQYYSSADSGRSIIARDRSCFRAGKNDSGNCEAEGRDLQG